MKIYLLCIIITVLVVSCNRDDRVSISDPEKLEKFLSPVSSDSIVLNDTISIAFQDTIGNSHENIWISFDSIGADSRCPVNVQCIWQGNAEISVCMFNQTSRSVLKLNTHPSFPGDTIVYGYKIELIDLLPYPHTDSLYTDQDHLLKLVVSK